MKNNIILLALLLALLPSCSEDFLDLTPLDSLTPEQVFTTEENLKMYITSLYELRGTFPTSGDIYGVPTNGGVGDWQYVTDARSDITLTGAFVERYYVPGAFTPFDVEHWYWDELRRINYFIDNYDKSEAPEEVKNHYAGIARWFRAKFYFDKVSRFGDVPWYNSTLGSTDEDLYKGRDSRDMVMNLVLEDLDFAIEHISNQKDASSTTVTKWVALGLKSRICLFEGTFRKYHPELGLGNAEVWLQHAADAAKEVMESGQYAIHTTGLSESDYHDLFISDDAVSQEVMLANAHSDELEAWHSATMFFSNAGGRYMTSLIKRFVNSYLNIDGSRFTDIPGYDTIFFSRATMNRDLRLSQTIRTPGYTRSDGSTPAPYGAVSTTLYHPIKYSHPDPYFDDVGRNVNDIPLMRYAEILLNYAEAKAELGTFTTADWDKTIGLLRERAGITNTQMPETIDPYMQEYFFPDVTSIPIMEIRRERGIELILERFRWDDLMRWKAGKNLEQESDGIYVPAMDTLYDLNDDGKPDVSFVRTQPANAVSGVYYMVIDDNSIKLSEGNKGRILVKPNLEKIFPDYKYLLPLPILELQLNSNLVQNKGWD